jgi:hypothetical protein
MVHASCFYYYCNARYDIVYNAVMYCNYVGLYTTLQCMNGTTLWRECFYLLLQTYKHSGKIHWKYVNVVYVFCILQIYFLCDLLLSCYTSGKVQHTMQTYKSTPFPGNDYTMYKKRTKRNYTCILITLHTPLRMHLVYGMLFCSYIHVKHITFSERYYSYYTGLI